MTEHQEAPARFTFGVASTHGIVLGLDIARLAALGAGTVLAAVSLMAHLPVPLAVILAAAGIAACYGRVKGTPLISWAGPIAGYVSRTKLASRLWTAPIPEGALATGAASRAITRPTTRGATTTAARPSPDRDVPLPPEWGRGKIAEAKIGARPVGLIAERRPAAFGLGGPRWHVTGVLEATSPLPFALRPRDEQVEAIGAWGQVLSETCVEAGAIHAVQWVERQVPDVAGAAAAWMGRHLASSTDPSRAEDYAALLDRLDAVSSVHEVYVAVDVSSHVRDRAEAIAAACFELQLIATRLGAIGLEITPLDADALSGLLVAAVAGVPRSALAPSQHNGPAVMAREEHWDALRVDGLWHRSLCVSAWPRTEVGPAWLEPLLVAASPGAVRTIAVHLHPTPPSVSRRHVTVRRTTAEANVEQRRRRGWLVGARETREATEAARRDAELVAGYGEHRIAAVVSIAAPSKDALAAATRAVQAAGARSGIDLSVLYGRQSDAMVASLPLARLAMRATGGF